MRELYDQNEYADREYDSSATPTIEAVRATYATDYYMTDVRGGVTAEERAAAFDRWLAAHDAEVRAGVVAEEPEWEYAYDSIADAEAERPSVRRRKAGPWVPVKQEEKR